MKYCHGIVMMISQTFIITPHGPPVQNSVVHTAEKFLFCPPYAACIIQQEVNLSPGHHTMKIQFTCLMQQNNESLKQKTWRSCKHVLTVVFSLLLEPGYI